LASGSAAMEQKWRRVNIWMCCCGNALESDSSARAATHESWFAKQAALDYAFRCLRNKNSKAKRGGKPDTNPHPLPPFLPSSTNTTATFGSSGHTYMHLQQYQRAHATIHQHTENVFLRRAQPKASLIYNTSMDDFLAAARGSTSGSSLVDRSKQRHLQQRAQAEGTQHALHTATKKTRYKMGGRASESE
jgi:hypothetical protein